MFESMKSRWWALRIAEHEMIKAMLKTDGNAVRNVARQFEVEMRATKEWPFDSSEQLALHFSVWLGGQTDLIRQLQVTPRDFGI